MESFTSNQKLMQDCSLLKYLQRFFGFVFFFNIILFAVCQHKEVKPQSSADLRVFVSGPLGEFTRFKLLKQFETFAAVSLLGCNQQSLSGSKRSSGATLCQSIHNPSKEASTHASTVFALEWDQRQGGVKGRSQHLAGWWAWSPPWHRVFQLEKWSKEKMVRPTRRNPDAFLRRL